MRAAIMQPYFLPYIGYFQLIKAVDVFVIYDNIEFTKKGWINRNRILLNDKDIYFTLPLKKDSDYLDINQRKLAESYRQENSKIVRKVAEIYKKAPHYDSIMPLIKKIFVFKDENLFNFIYNSLQVICNYLEIKTKFIISSSVLIDHTLKSQDKIIAICEKLEVTDYINAIGGKELYNEEVFNKKGIMLKFIKSQSIYYDQFKNDYIPWLSIIDVLMFNSIDETKLLLDKYDLI